VNETLTELKQWKYASTETAAATDCRYLDYDSNPARIPYQCLSILWNSISKCPLVFLQWF